MTIITDDDARRTGQGGRRGGRRAGRLAGDHEQRDRRSRARLADTLFPMAPPRNLHDAMLAADEIIIMTNLEWANRFAHVSAVRESCANNVKIASVEGGMGDWDLKVADILASTDRAVAAIEKLKGVGQGPRLDAPGHRRHGVASRTARPAGDAHPPARLDDGPAAAVGGGRLRRGGGPDQRRHRGRPATCWASAWMWSAAPSTGTSRTASVVKSRASATRRSWRGSSRACPTSRSWPSSRSAPATSRRSGSTVARRAASATSTSRWATTGTHTRAARTPAPLHLDGVVPQRDPGDPRRRRGYIFRDGQWDV